ncbi:hypothetical protein ACIQU6_38345 [Streptomyces sp. NPDC090442]
MGGLADDEVCIGDRYEIGGAVFGSHPTPRDVLTGRLRGQVGVAK